MIILVGKQASGKTTVVDKLVKDFGYTKAVTYTTRKPRPGEIEGKDYFFVSDKKFEEMKKEGLFAETAAYDAAFGHVSYGSLLSDYKDVTAKKAIILNPYGLKAIRNKGITANAYFLDVSAISQRNRLLNRGDDIAEIRRRIKADNEDFGDIENLDVIRIDADKPLKDVVNCINFEENLLTEGHWSAKT